MPKNIIWLTIFALMILGNWNNRLDLGGFFLLLFIGVGLSRMFGSEQKTTKPETEPEMDEVRPDDVIRIRRRSVELLRNSLMRHHNSRGTDMDYQISAAAKETTEILQILNAALSKKIAHHP